MKPPGRRLAKVALAEQAIGGADRIFTIEGLDYPVAISARALAEHKPGDLARLQYLPLLPEALTRPQEVWAGFERPKLSAEAAAAVAARTQPPPPARFTVRLISAVQRPGRDRQLLVVAGVNRSGLLETITASPTADARYINARRWGRLLRADDREAP